MCFMTIYLNHVMRNYNRCEMKPRDLHIIYKQSTKLSNTVLKMPEQHFLLVYPRRSGQPFHFEQISLLC